MAMAFRPKHAKWMFYTHIFSLLAGYFLKFELVFKFTTTTEYPYVNYKMRLATAV